MKKAIIVGIGILILIWVIIPIPSNELTIRLYDKDMNPLVIVGPTEGLGTPNVAFIKLGVSAKNTGSTILTCEVSDLKTEGIGITTNFFDNSIVRETKIIEPKKREYWITDLIDAEEILKQSAEVTFKASVNCYNEDFSKTKTNQITLKFFPEGTPQGTARVFITNE